ncbi:hypothetical protein C0J52_26454 [Blattella germanica]|nr:hypothetical protein C0J52_26454 [Blattella germanica]
MTPRQVILQFAVLALVASTYSARRQIPPYVKQCKLGDPQMNKCIIQAFHQLSPYLAKGIPEFGVPSMEPFRTNEVFMSLTTGPNPFKVTFQDLQVFGGSNYRVKSLKLSNTGKSYDAQVHFPELKMNARYKSSGVLVGLPAIGQGYFEGMVGDILATIRGTISWKRRDGQDFLHVERLDIDWDIKAVDLQVKKVFNNPIITEQTNRFLRQNKYEVLRIIKPQLRLQLSEVFLKISNQLLSHVPKDMFLM